MVITKIRITIPIIGCNEQIPNSQLNPVSPKINNANIIQASNNLNKEIGNLLCSLFLALANVNSKQIAENPVPIMHKLE